MSLMDIRLNQTTAIIATEAFTELHMGNEGDQRAESKNLFHPSIYMEIQNSPC